MVAVEFSMEANDDTIAATSAAKAIPFIPDGTNREVNSLVHHLGVILEEHINN